jgi:hypothetical protein
MDFGVSPVFRMVFFSPLFSVTLGGQPALNRYFGSTCAYPFAELRYCGFGSIMYHLPQMLIRSTNV